jgi:hypothetical protein
MTRHVRTGYRKHRKAAWGLALVFALILAAAVIPLASGGTSGGRPAAYTFTGDAAACAGQNSVTFPVTLTNMSKTQNLGSADLYAPLNITVTDATITAGGGSGYVLKPIGPAPLTPPGFPAGSHPSLISLRSLQVPGTTPPSSVTVSVTANVSPNAGSGPLSWYSIAKQANSFNPGDLDTSNALANQDRNPTFTVSNCELRFFKQPPNPWEKGKTATAEGSVPEVAVYAGTTQVDVGGTPPPALSAVVGGTNTDASSDFSFGSATYSSSTLSWTWPNAMPTSTADGYYNLVATLGSMTATSDSNSTTNGNQPFQVVDSLCPAGQTCPPVASNSDPNAAGTGALGIDTTTLQAPVILDFGPPGGASCDPWPNRASYLDSSGNRVYFPAVELSYTWGVKMLKVTYYIRNSEWVLTDTSRGNQDAEFCVGAHHQNMPNDDGTHPFIGKYGPAGTHWDGTNYFAVVKTVANPSKVGSDPVICGRGNKDLTFNGVTETWRGSTLCIPYDWDLTSKP